MTVSGLTITIPSATRPTLVKAKPKSTQSKRVNRSLRPMRSIEDIELMPQREDLELQGRSRTTAISKRREKKAEYRHRSEGYSLAGGNSNHVKKKRIFGGECDQRRLACSVGVSPTGARVRSPVAWVAFVEETKRMKPTDKAILGMVSESPGRNASEPRGGLDKNKPEGRALYVSGEGSMAWRRLTDAACHFGGVVGAAR